jgi:hypothetical protein
MTGENDPFHDLDLQEAIDLRWPEVQEPGKAARPQVHANAMGLQHFGWTLPIHSDQARQDTARPRGGSSGPPNLPRGIR